MRIMPLLCVITSLSACAAGPPTEAQQRRAATETARLDKALSGFSPGKERSCIDLRDANGPQSFGETTLLFRTGSRLVYRTETNGSCKGVGVGGRALVTRTHSSQLCSGDIAQVIENPGGFFAGSCAMGKFTPYRRN